MLKPKESNEILLYSRERLVKKYLKKKISNVNFEDKLELQYVKLPHFFYQLGICIILYLLADYSITKKSLIVFLFIV